MSKTKVETFPTAKTKVETSTRLKVTATRIQRKRSKRRKVTAVKQTPPSPNTVKSISEKKVPPSPKRRNPVRSRLRVRSLSKKKVLPRPKTVKSKDKVSNLLSSKEAGHEVPIEFTIEMKDLRLKGKIEEFIRQYHLESENKNNEYIVGTQTHYSVQEKGYFVCISNTVVGMDPLCWISENYDLYRPRSAFKVGNVNKKEYIFVRGNVASYYDVGMYTKKKVKRKKK